jgi:hypothetical protein
MADAPTIDWKGRSGSTYHYWIYRFWPNLKASPGNYIFARQTQPGYWLPVYIGQSGNLAERFDQHHKIEAARRQGATHIHVHLNSGGEQARRDEEADLIAAWRPPCND